MPSWDFELTDGAADELAAIWPASGQRAAVTAAMVTVERLLTRDPSGTGEQLAEGLWASNCPPLRTLYEIDAVRREVNSQTIKESSH